MNPTCMDQSFFQPMITQRFRTLSVIFCCLFNETVSCCGSIWTRCQSVAFLCDVCLVPRISFKFAINKVRSETHFNTET